MTNPCKHGYNRNWRCECPSEEIAALKAENAKLRTEVSKLREALEMIRDWYNDSDTMASKHPVAIKARRALGKE